MHSDVDLRMQKLKKPFAACGPACHFNLRFPLDCASVIRLRQASLMKIFNTAQGNKLDQYLDAEATYEKGKRTHAVF